MEKNQTRIIEIRAAEGGDDARLFAAELASAYTRWCDRKAIAYKIEPEPDHRRGNQILALTVNGTKLDRLIQEAGGHRVQRIPFTERRGRVHTSTVTVAIIERESGADTSIFRQRNSEDFRIEWFNGTIKAGGQHHQKNATCCRIIHIPTGILKTAQTRSRVNSQKEVMQAIITELDARVIEMDSQAINGLRRSQVGSGQRGDKRRTYRFQEDSVFDHINNRRARARDIMSGQFDLLWV